MGEKKSSVYRIKSGIQRLFDPWNVYFGVFNVWMKSVNGDGASAKKQKESNLAKVG